MKTPRINTDYPALGRPAANLVEADLTNAIIGAFYEVYNELGYGFLESVYRKALQLELKSRGLRSRREAPIEVFYRGDSVGLFRADLIVETRVIVEVKAIHALAEPEHKQLLNYLRATSAPVGLLLNFGPRPTFKRVVLTTRKADKRGRIEEPKNSPR